MEPLWEERGGGGAAVGGTAVGMNPAGGSVVPLSAGGSSLRIMQPFRPFDAGKVDFVSLPVTMFKMRCFRCNSLPNKSYNLMNIMWELG